MSDVPKTAEKFNNIDFHLSKPIPDSLKTIEVVITSENLLDDYARAFVNEGYRVNQLKAQRVQLTEQEMIDYCGYLLTKRVQCVDRTIKDFRDLKLLWIPAWIQHALSLVGEVIDRKQGFKITPIMEEPSKMSFQEALRISEKIGAFENDLQMVQDAMPRKLDGNENVMMTALIADRVRGIKEVEHDTFVVVSVFLGMKIKEEALYASYYVHRYDDPDYIRAAFTATRDIY